MEERVGHELGGYHFCTCLMKNRDSPIIPVHQQMCKILLIHNICPILGIIRLLNFFSTEGYQQCLIAVCSFLSIQVWLTMVSGTMGLTSLRDRKRFWWMSRMPKSLPVGIISFWSLLSSRSLIPNMQCHTVTIIPTIHGNRLKELPYTR